MHLKIWHKMIIGISIPSLIALTGGLVTYGYINDVKNRQNYVLIADDLKENVLEVRRNEKNFLHSRNEENLRSLQNAMKYLENLLSSVSVEAVAEIGEREFDLIKKTAQSHSLFITELYDSFLKESDYTNKLRDEGRKLESFVATKRHAKELSTNFILNLRRQEKNYMLFRDDTSYREFEKGISQIKNITPFCFECDPYIQSVQNLFAAYEKSDALVEELLTNGDRLEEAAGRVAFRERQKIASFITHTQRLLLGALVLLCILGPLFVYKTASYIVAPIKRLADIIKKIHAGNLSLRAPIKEYDETHSLAISFNNMLDHLEGTQQSLKESLTLLNEKQAQLVESEKRASLGFLVAGVAHELNNPLNNISLTAESMKEDLREFTYEESMEHIQDILIQSERARTIVENLLDFARARRSAVMEKIDIVTVVKESLRLVSNHLRINAIHLVQEIPQTAFYIKGNRSKLEQILISIITNAVESMNGAGTLTVSVRPGVERGHIEIEITDTGCGIPREDLKNIFEPFFTKKNHGNGTGLGLSICRTLVEEHQGEIDVKSNVGEGASFIIRFPGYTETS